MSALTQMVIFSAFASIALLLVLLSGNNLISASNSREVAELDLARAKLENGFFHAAYCGEDCNIDVELSKNITLELSNQTCLLFDENNNSVSCYFPFSIGDVSLNGSAFRVKVKKTKLEVEAVG